VPAAHRRLERRRIGPGRRLPARHRGRHEAGLLEHRVDLLAAQAVVLGEVRARGHAERAAGLADEAGQAGRVVRVVGQHRGRQHAVRQVVDALPAPPRRAHHLADVEQPLDRDLDVAPVPPLAAPLPAAQLAGGQRPLRPQAVEHAAQRAPRHGVPALPAGPERPPPEPEPRPFLHRQHAGRVRPVLEGLAAPVGALDRFPPDRPEPRVGHELVRARQHGDRVELHRAQRAQHRRDAPAPRARPDQPLRAQRDAPRLVGAQLDDRLRSGGGGHGRRDGQ
jgi:hypothetical protein